MFEDRAESNQEIVIIIKQKFPTNLFAISWEFKK